MNIYEHQGAADRDRRDPGVGRHAGISRPGVGGLDVGLVPTREAMDAATRRPRSRHWARNELGHVVFTQPGHKPPRITQMMTYPFPLHRDGEVVWVRVVLPDDLTAHEAERIGQMLTTLPVPQETT